MAGMTLDTITGRESPRKKGPAMSLSEKDQAEVGKAGKMLNNQIPRAPTTPSAPQTHAQRERERRIINNKNTLGK